jgi:hypothetical protein
VLQIILAVLVRWLGRPARRWLVLPLVSLLLACSAHAQAQDLSAHPGSQQALCGKQGHLGVVGDHAQAAIRGGIGRDAIRAKAALDLRSLHELYWRAQSIADSATQQAAEKPIVYCPTVLPLKHCRST